MTTSRCLYANDTGWKFHVGWITSWPFWFTNVCMAWHRHTSLTNFITQQSWSFKSVCIPLRLTNCLFPVPDSQPTATELFQSPQYRSGTVFRSILHLLCHFLSSALAWRHTSSNSVTSNYRCHAREVTLSFIDTLIALTYLQNFRMHLIIAPQGLFLVS